jgi:hypothetical protein
MILVAIVIFVVIRCVRVVGIIVMVVGVMDVNLLVDREMVIVVVGVLGVLVVLLAEGVLELELDRIHSRDVVEVMILVLIL